MELRGLNCYKFLIGPPNNNREVLYVLSLNFFCHPESNLTESPAAPVRSIGLVPV